MKRLLLCFSCIMAIVLLSGCSMSNTPTKKVENFLDNYKNQDETVITQLRDMVDMDNLMNDDQKTTYEDIMKKQYEDLTYEIKDEVIDGDTATVTAEIEVYDYYRINEEAQTYYNENPGEFSDDTTDNNDGGLIGDATRAIENKAEERVGVENEDQTDEDAGIGTGGENENNLTSDEKYIEYRLGKLKEAENRVTYTIDFTLTLVDDVWTLNAIDDITRQKIHGLYEH